MVGKSSPPSAAKLPATAHGRRTRAAIIDAAAQMMYQKGVAATSLDDILAASSTGKSQLYHYFKDRSELVKAVVERQTELVLAAQPTLTQIDSMDGVEQWAQAILANHDVPGGPFGCPLGSMAAELKNDPAYQPALAAAVLATLQGGMLMGRATMDITVLRDSLEMALDSIRRALRD
ncbi:TetR/AcrR family transcriptional regulator [Mycobacteroides abscessus]|uniref:TetR/AcrR family transcriptional regulator n=1 Tax=Mycobacteroides abscessus TaxID=36809 RepID=UPI0013F5E869|nr:TetR/AcrR family transcriptional regulator [Mycobacteroides abscessus]